MAHRCVVLVKQVPDTKRITGKAMRADGTVNRAVLPAIFNPDDLFAIEMALGIRERYGGSVAVITMGPPRAADVLRDALCRGVDRVILLTDRRAAASDTLATSYILSCAVRKLGEFDIVLCGRQAIDGDTAQVPPQTAEKLGIPQITYVDRVEEVVNSQLRAHRNTGEGFEVVRCPLPLLLTVTDAAGEPRPPSAKRMMKFKKSRAVSEIEREVKQQMPDESEAVQRQAVEKRVEELKENGLLIEQWDIDHIGVEESRCGLSGSPTKVKRVQYIVLKGSGFKLIEPTDEGLFGLVHELIEDHTIG